MPAPRKYDQETRDRAVRMFRERRQMHPAESAIESRRQVGALIDVKSETLRGWIERGDVDAGARPGVTTEDEGRGLTSTGGRAVRRRPLPSPPRGGCRPRSIPTAGGHAHSPSAVSADVAWPGIAMEWCCWGQSCGGRPAVAGCRAGPMRHSSWRESWYTPGTAHRWRSRSGTRGRYIQVEGSGIRHGHASRTSPSMLTADRTTRLRQRTRMDLSLITESEDPIGLRNFNSLGSAPPPPEVIAAAAGLAPDSS